MREEKQENRMVKQLKVKEPNRFFSAFNWACGGLAGGYHSEIYNLALWCCSDQMSRGWHKQNKKDWSPFSPETSCCNPARAPPPPWIILFLLLFYVSALYHSLHLSLLRHVFNLFDWRQASHGCLIIEFKSLSARITVFMSVVFTLQFGLRYWCIEKMNRDKKVVHFRQNIILALFAFVWINSVQTTQLYFFRILGLLVIWYCPHVWMYLLCHETATIFSTSKISLYVKSWAWI